MKLSILIVVHNGSVISIKPAHDYWKNSIYYILFVCANDECECAYAHWYCWLALCYTRVTIKSIRCRIGWWMNWKTCRVRQMQELKCYYTRDNRHTQTQTHARTKVIWVFFFGHRAFVCCSIAGLLCSAQLILGGCRRIDVGIISIQIHIWKLKVWSMSQFIWPAGKIRTI